MTRKELENLKVGDIIIFNQENHKIIEMKGRIVVLKKRERKMGIPIHIPKLLNDAFKLKKNKVLL